MFSLQGQRLRRELNSHKARLKPRAPVRISAACRVKAPALVRFAAEVPNLQCPFSQSVEPPPPEHLRFGLHLCGGGKRCAQSRHADKTSDARNYGFISARSMSALSKHKRLQAGRISFGAVESRVTSSLAALPPNPSLSPDPLRQASLPVWRAGLCCTTRASRPASAVGVSSNVRPQIHHFPQKNLA